MSLYDVDLRIVLITTIVGMEELRMICLDDDALLSLLVHSPDKGLEKLMDKWMGFVYAIVSGKLSNVCSKQDVEECVSDVFYKTYQSRERIDLSKGTLKSYLAVLARRTAIDVYRKHQNTGKVIPLDELDMDPIDENNDVAAIANDNETNDQLLVEIRALGEPDSQIIIRKYYFGQSAKDISKALGIKENTINKRASRALDKLKLSLGGIL